MRHGICIHGHFYQPVREDPWTGRIGYQAGAAPYHDWNERVLDECYAPNTAARILDADGWTRDILNTFAWTSFDAGPTLLSWIEEQDPDTYQAILAGDREAQSRFGGHGSAIAQAYHHAILPLLPRKQKEQEVRGGIEDFTSRFGRYPEGMWLPEMAVDEETLEVLAAEGIRFTILEPSQVAAMQLPGETTWRDLPSGITDPVLPVLCPLPSGESIAIFFSDTPVSHRVAFGDLLEDGGRFADAILARLPADRMRPALVSVATDGETYGHHKRFGEMALAYAIETIGQDTRARLTVFGEFLDAQPPLATVRICERSSWSCCHNLARWNGECSCGSRNVPGWTPGWRSVLRAAADSVRGPVLDYVGKEISLAFREPGSAVDDLPRLARDPSPEGVLHYFARHGLCGDSPEARGRALLLLDALRNIQRMYTSCGWFFDDIAGIEAIQVMRYAARAIQVCRDLGGPDLEAVYRAVLHTAPVNTPGYRNGAEVYDRLVVPWMLNDTDFLLYSVLSSPRSPGPFQVHSGITCASGRVIQVDASSTAMCSSGTIAFSSPRTSPPVSHAFAVREGGPGRTVIVLAGGDTEREVQAKAGLLAEALREPVSPTGPGEWVRFTRPVAGSGTFTYDQFTPQCRTLALEREVTRCLEGILAPGLSLPPGPGWEGTEDLVPVPPVASAIASFRAVGDLISGICAGRADMREPRGPVTMFRRSPSPEGERAIARAADLQIRDLVCAALGPGRDPGPLHSAVLVARVLDAASVTIPLRSTERTLFSVARDILPEETSFAAAGDSRAGNWCDSFRLLAVSLRVKLP